MNIIKKTIRRCFMTCLFVLALLTTFQTFSGVEAKDLSDWLSENKYKTEAKQQLVRENSGRNVGLLSKFLHFVGVEPTSISSSEEIKSDLTLEEVIDFSKYPTKTVVATGYTAGVESTGKTPDHPGYGITFSGVKVKRDLYSTIAADISIFPLGTILYIPDYGYGVVADTGGAIKGHKLDLYYETVAEVYEHWGKKTINVYVIELGNGKLTEETLANLNEEESMQVFRQRFKQSKS